MTHTTGKDQVVRVNGAGKTAAKVDEVRCLYRQGSGGPEASFAASLRHLSEIGAEFEKIRMLSGRYEFTTEQAMKLLQGALAGGREPTFEEVLE